MSSDVLETGTDPGTEGSSIGNPVRVVSGVIFRDGSRREVLLGVRRRVPTSIRHPGVLSTPTMRLPAAFFGSLVEAAGPSVPLREPGAVMLERQERFAIGHGPSLRHPGAFVLESLLARKLGLAGALMMRRFAADASALAVALDHVEDALGTGKAEWTTIITYSLTITEGADELPAQTESYSRIIWAEATLLGRALASRDALLLDESLNPFEVCIQGLCVRSAVFALEGKWLS